MIYMEGNASLWIFLAVLLPLMLILMWCAYAFPLVARFQNSTKQVIKNSFLMGLRSLPWTILLACMLLGSAALIFLVPFGLLYLPAAEALMSSMILERIFVQYMSPEDLARERERNKKAAEEQ